MSALPYERDPALGPGGDWTLRSYPIADPGAGSTWSIVVPGDRDWRVVALNQIMATSAVVANRVPYLRLRAVNRELVRVPQGVVVPPSSSVFLQYAAGLGELWGSVSEGMVLAPLPALPIEPGITIDWLCTGLQAGDAVSFITLSVLERWTGATPPTRERRGELVPLIDFEARVDA